MKNRITISTIIVVLVGGYCSTIIMAQQANARSKSNVLMQQFQKLQKALTDSGIESKSADVLNTLKFDLKKWLSEAEKTGTLQSDRRNFITTGIKFVDALTKKKDILVSGKAPQGSPDNERTLQEQINILKAQIRTMQSEVQGGFESKSSSPQESEVAPLRQELQILKESESRQQQLIETLRQQSATSASELEALRQKVAGSAEQATLVQRLQEENSKVQGELERLRASEQQSANSASDLQGKIEKLTFQLTAALGEKERLTTENQQLQSSALGEAGELRNKLIEKEAALARVTGQNKATVEQINKLQQQEEAQKALVAQLQQAEISLNTQIAQLKKEVAGKGALEEEVALLKKTNDDISKKLTTLATSEKDSVSQLETVKQQLAQTEAVLEEKKRRLETLESASKAASQASQLLAQKATQELEKKHKQEIAALQAQLDAAKQEAIAKNTEIAKLTAAAKSICAAKGSQQTVQEFQGIIDTLTQEIDALAKKAGIASVGK